MKRLIRFTSVLLLGFYVGIHSAEAQEDQAYIQVIGEAEIEVFPDEIIVQMSLQRSEIKRSIEEVEQDLYQKMKEEGLEPDSNLFVRDLTRNVYKRWLRKNKKLESRDYEIELHSKEEVSKLFQIFKELDIPNASIQSTEYSKEQEIKNQLLDLAIKNAKRKAEILLGPVNQSVGAVLILSEDLPETFERRFQSGAPGAASSYSRRLSGSVLNVRGAGLAQAVNLELPPLTFKKTIYARFSID